MPSVTTSKLEIAYEDSGPQDGPVVLLLHGWPDDASSWNTVAARLNGEGFRTLVPTLRGFGATRFIRADMPRTGSIGALAVDAIEFCDALGIETLFVAGHDWGASIAEALAIGWPERVVRLAMLSSAPRLGGLKTPPFWHAQLQWYHWFMATKRGEEAVRNDPHGFAHIHWVNWAPPGWFSEETFAAVAKSFSNSDWVDVTLHSYRSRWGEADLDPDTAWLDEKVSATETLTLPSIYVHGQADGVNPPEATKSVPSKFSGPFESITLPGVGHFPQREAPEAVAQLLIRHFGAT